MFNRILSLGLATVTLLLFSPVTNAEQVIIQGVRSSATAEGRNNSATSSVRQSARQNRSNYSQQNQISNQQGHSSSTAIGENNRVTNTIRQSSTQNQLSNFREQTSTQRGTSKGTAMGANNTINGNIRQNNQQN